MNKYVFLIILLFSCQIKNKVALPILNYNFNSAGEKEYYFIRYSDFTDQFGNEFNEDRMKDRIALINFFFTSCPSICPPMQKNLRDLVVSLDMDDIVVISHTIDPATDTTEKLLDYSVNFELDNIDWYFIRSNLENINRIADLYKTNFRPNDSGTDFFHSSYVTLVDSELNIRGFYDILNEKERRLLRKDIKLLND